MLVKILKNLLKNIITSAFSARHNLFFTSEWRDKVLKRAYSKSAFHWPTMHKCLGPFCLHFGWDFNARSILSEKKNLGFNEKFWVKIAKMEGNNFSRPFYVDLYAAHMSCLGREILNGDFQIKYPCKIMIFSFFTKNFAKMHWRNCKFFY